MQSSRYSSTKHAGGTVRFEKAGYKGHRRSGRLRGEPAASEEEGADHDESEHEAAALATPKAKPRPRAVKKNPPATTEEPAQSEEQAVEGPISDEEVRSVNGVDETPRASRKRPRTEDDDVDMESNANEENPENASESQDPEANEIVVRRKRVRH